MARGPLTGRVVAPALFLMAFVGVVVACGGSDGNVDTTTPDASTGDGASTQPPTSDAGGTLSDSGTEVIGDGGANLDPDAGDTTLPDGGKCNDIVNSAKAIVSTCASTAPILGGGTIVAGTYALVSVTALGTPSFCNSQFVATGLKETLEITASANGFDSQTVTEIGGGGARRRSQTMTAQQGQLVVTQTCPTSATLATRYASGIVNGKQRLVMRLPYGKGEGLYAYELP